MSLSRLRPPPSVHGGGADGQGPSDPPAVLRGPPERGMASPREPRHPLPRHPRPPAGPVRPLPRTPPLRCWGWCPGHRAVTIKTDAVVDPLPCLCFLPQPQEEGGVAYVGQNSCKLPPPPPILPSFIKFPIQYKVMGVEGGGCFGVGKKAAGWLAPRPAYLRDSWPTPLLRSPPGLSICLKKLETASGQVNIEPHFSFFLYHFFGGLNATCQECSKPNPPAEQKLRRTVSPLPWPPSKFVPPQYATRRTLSPSTR